MLTGAAFCTQLSGEINTAFHFIQGGFLLVWLCRTCNSFMQHNVLYVV